jgi:hypothetical protein
MTPTNSDTKTTSAEAPEARCAGAHTSAAFERWWHDEGSGFPPLDGEDRETHMHRVAKIAWSNGAYLERNAITEVIRSLAVVREQNQIIRELYGLIIDKAHALLSEPRSGGGCVE